MVKPEIAEWNPIGADHRGRVLKAFGALDEAILGKQSTMWCDGIGPDGEGADALVSEIEAAVGAIVQNHCDHRRAHG